MVELPMVDLLAGGPPPPLAGHEPANTPLNPAIARFLAYIKHQKRYSEHTVRAYRTDLWQFEAFYIDLNQDGGAAADLPNLVQAQPGDVRAWVISLMDDERISPRSINRKLASLRAFYKFLHRRADIGRTPMQKVRLLKADRKISPFVPRADTERMAEQLQFSDDFAGQRDQLVVELLYGTGIRLSELIGLHQRDINFYDGTIKVWGKKNKQRLVPVHPPLLQFIKAYTQRFVAASSWLITTNQGEQAYPALIYRTVRRVLDQVTTVERRSPHVLRHTFATHLLDHGADLNAIKDLLGHSSLASTQVYAHNSIEKLKKVFEQAHPKA
jgi:integrase/recombinase XerC